MTPPKQRYIYSNDGQHYYVTDNPSEANDLNAKATPLDAHSDEELHSYAATLTKYGAELHWIKDEHNAP